MFQIANAAGRGVVIEEAGLDPVISAEARRRGHRVPASAIAVMFLLALASCVAFPRASRGAVLVSVTSAVGVLGISTMVVLLRRRRQGIPLTWQFSAKPVHYVQMMMHCSIYVYWGWYWREVYRYIPLIVIQLLFAYAVEMLVSWCHRSRWHIGFGPFPVVLSTNLFIWFRDDYWYWQLIVITVALLSKEYLHWYRHGRSVHIFNPSAFGLFCASAVLLVSGSSSVTKGMEIAFTLAYPPRIYELIFVLGLIVQSMFSVTLVTLSAVATLFVMSWSHGHMAGGAMFANDPISPLVFLGCHLLITDPATSPRSKVGRAIFGVLYGTCVFLTRGLLTSAGQPAFFDKLLCVPFLNLSVPSIDAFSAWLSKQTKQSHAAGAQLLAGNWTHMVLWTTLCLAINASGFLKPDVSGMDAGRLTSNCVTHGITCQAWIRSLWFRCDKNEPAACLELGRVLRNGFVVPVDIGAADLSLRRACALGLETACGE